MTVKQVESLVPDIYKAIETKQYEVSEEKQEELIQECLQDIEHNLREFVTNIREDEDFRLRMSNVGVAGRKLWYDKNGDSEKEEMPAKLLLTFLQGHLLEAILLMVAELSGHEVSHKQHEIEIAGIKGHMDAVIDGTLIDVKTAAPYSFVEKFVKGGILNGKDPFGYSLQADGYAQALGIEKRGWLSMNKATGELNLLLNDSFINDAEEQIEKKKKDLEADEPPQQCYQDKPEGKAGNRILGSECSWCNHKVHCWEDLRAFKYSNGTKYFTHVEKEPKVDEIQLPKVS